MVISTGAAAILGLGASLFGSASAANAQENASEAQIALAREQRALQEDVYDREMGVLRNTKTQNIGDIRNTFGNAMDAERNLLQFGRENARNVYGRNQNIAQDIFGRQRTQFQNALARNIAGYQPYAESGDRARGLRDYEMGLSEALPSGVSALSMSPAARFALEQGLDSVEAGAVSGGSARSGATIAALEKLRMGMAAQDRETQLDRLMGIADQGLSARTSMAGERNNYAGNMADALGNYGNARLANSTALGSQLQAVRQQFTGNQQNLRLGRLDALTGARNNFATGVGNAGNNFTQGAGDATQMQQNALANYGDAQAAASVGVANAFNNGLNNYYAMQQYNQLQRQPNAGTTTPQPNPYY